jgi:hypothetical protein
MFDLVELSVYLFMTVFKGKFIHYYGVCGWRNSCGLFEEMH